ncbi:Aardvark [Cavenderia fasciculata]|uniref:Aardvark n=1 Tax=Cavenderia fasciculata TaxID=261658 RepID=F4Q9R5_CACFS|nr:Aardvark [Cavenderia fasciculata]EGG15434.1 Aardvark [Cavenderia fasciculata]|eukprot:XP_004354176.1 Aardvark [Cavenderia fasciculata]
MKERSSPMDYHGKGGGVDSMVTIYMMLFILLGIIVNNKYKNIIKQPFKQNIHHFIKQQILKHHLINNSHNNNNIIDPIIIAKLKKENNYYNKEEFNKDRYNYCNNYYYSNIQIFILDSILPDMNNIRNTTSSSSSSSISLSSSSTSINNQTPNHTLNSSINNNQQPQQGISGGPYSSFLRVFSSLSKKSNSLLSLPTPSSSTSTLHTDNTIITQPTKMIKLNNNNNNNNINNNNNNNNLIPSSIPTSIMIDSQQQIEPQALHNYFQQDHQQQFIFDIFSIPTEMLVHLLSFFPARDLWKMSLACKRMWHIVEVFKFWGNLFERTCPRIFYAMQYNSRWTANPPQIKMILCLMEDLPEEFWRPHDGNDENGQIKKIIGIMKVNPHSSLIQRECCYILKRLSYRQRKEDEHEALIARYDGIKLILNAMKNHPLNHGVQEDACGALGNLTCDSPNSFGVYSNNNYLEVVELDGIKLILQAMRNHVHNPGVQYNTSFVLRNLARNDLSESRVAQEGGIHAIATAMRNHPNHIGIQTQGCGALRNLGCNDKNKVLSAKEGGINLILNSMRNFASHPDLQLNGCGALRNLARNEKNKDLITKLGGIQLVLQAMTNHYQDPDVQDEGCAALINLAYQDETNEETIAREGGIKLILQAMRNHPFHAGVQMQGRGALKNLSCNPKNKLTIARSGGISLMEIACINHPSYSNRFLELMRILQSALEEAPLH